MLRLLRRCFLLMTVFTSWALLSYELHAGYIINFSGTIDGSDVIQIQPHQATWNHLYWSYPPSPVTFNGVSWNPQAMPTLNFGGPALLPSDLSHYSITTNVLSGRDVAVGQIQNNNVLL